MYLIWPQNNIKNIDLQKTKQMVFITFLHEHCCQTQLGSLFELGNNMDYELQLACKTFKMLFSRPLKRILLRTDR